MKRFVIGQFEKFDMEKQKRDFRDYFWGIEATQMSSTDEIGRLKAYIDKNNIGLGIHFPLLNNQWKLRDPQYLSKDKEIYEASINYMEREFARAVEIHPEYILLHYPKPVILEDNVDWTPWRFSDSSEYYYESEMDFDYFKAKSDSFFKLLSSLGESYGIIPVIELDALNKYVYETTLLEELFEKYSNIKMCLDFGRIHIQACIDNNIDEVKLIKKFGKYAHLVHLWNAKIDSNGHFPALKTLKPEEGWGNMEKLFGSLNECNNNYKILFEHKSQLISDDELEECYKWIESLVG